MGDVFFCMTMQNLQRPFCFEKYEIHIHKFYDLCVEWILFIFYLFWNKSLQKQKSKQICNKEYFLAKRSSMKVMLMVMSIFK